MKMRIVGISGSPVAQRNTSYLVEKALQEAKRAIKAWRPDIEVETILVSLGKKKIMGCIDCMACQRKGTLCILKDDWLECVSHLIDPVPDGVIIGSPVYWHSTNSQLRAFLERFTCLFKYAWYKEFPIPLPDWSKTAAGALTVGYHRHGGQENAALNIISFLLSAGFVTVGSFSQEDGPIGYIAGTAWSGCPEAQGKEQPRVAADEFGRYSVEALGKRVGETALRLRLGDMDLSK